MLMTSHIRAGNPKLVKLRRRKPIVGVEGLGSE
jgi:hypothetical protein